MAAEHAVEMLLELWLLAEIAVIGGQRRGAIGHLHRAACRTEGGKGRAAHENRLPGLHLARIALGKAYRHAGGGHGGHISAGHDRECFFRKTVAAQLRGHAVGGVDLIIKP